MTSRNAADMLTLRVDLLDHGFTMFEILKQ
jgi:hypothetical protein